MKRLVFIFFLVFLIIGTVLGQGNSEIVSFQQVPIELHIQIGFLFVYILLGLLFFMMFLFYPRQRLNLHFSLYNIFLALMILNSQYFKTGGQGTGLGLSLAYDIVTKGHGGELKVETKEGEGSEFVITLPGNN